MKVSDTEILLIRDAVAREGLDRTEMGLETMISELWALRKVAEGALALERAMEDIPCKCSDRSCEVMCKALREAGL